MLRYALVLAGCVSALIGCAGDKLLTPDELDEILTVESVAFEPRGEVISADGPNGRATLFEVGLDPPHDQIDEERYEVSFESTRKD